MSGVYCITPDTYTVISEGWIVALYTIFNISFTTLYSNLFNTPNVCDNFEDTLHSNVSIPS